MSKNDFCIVYVTINRKNTALEIAEKLIEERLAACCTIISNVESVYFWEGKVQHDGELLMMIKSHLSKFSELERIVSDIHPYEVPEIIAVPIAQGSKKYIDWFEKTINK